MQQRKILSSDQLCVDSVETFNIMAAMTSYNEFHLVVSDIYRHKYIDGNDPDIRSQRMDHAHYLPLPRRYWSWIECCASWRYTNLLWMGEIPICLLWLHYLKWDIESKSWMWEDNGSLKDDTNSLRVLNETLEMVTIASCQRVEGNFIDLVRRNVCDWKIERDSGLGEYCCLLKLGEVLRWRQSSGVK